MSALKVGISTCPNDTFAFHHLLASTRESDAIEWVFDDVQALNERLAAGELDISKISFAAATRSGDAWELLPVGAALGFGVGPVVLTGNGTRDDDVRARVLTPGEDTTAHLLWRAFRPAAANVEHVVFDRVLERLAADDADLGVCIHEARFTYRERGLELALDLGATWEAATGLPLPLGGLAVRRTALERDRGAVAAFVRAARASIRRARHAPAACLPTMRQYAQEFDDDVLMEHVRLYVNDWTEELGLEGRAALERLAQLAADCGFAPASAAVRVHAPDERLFHFVDPDAWARREPDAVWQPPSLESEGFVHLSFRHQLEGTLAAHFAATDRVTLLEVELTDDAHLVVEPSRGDALFPHLFRGLAGREIVATHPLERTSKGWRGLPAVR